MLCVTFVQLVQPFVQDPAFVFIRERLATMDRLPLPALDMITGHLNIDELGNLMATNTTTATGRQEIMRIVLLRRRQARMRLRARLLLRRARRIDALVDRLL